MLPAHPPYPQTQGDIAARIGRAGVATAIVDGLFSSILSVAAYHSTVARLFQGVAATVIGTEAVNGGTRTALIGVLMHIGVAFWWSAVFVLVVMRSARIRSLVTSGKGVLGVAAVYGPAIWLVMSLVVIPVLLQRPPSFTVRWLIQLAGHFPFVGIPIVASASRGLARSEPFPRAS